MTTLWSTTCRDDADGVAVTVRVERAEGAGFDLHVHFPPPARQPELGPIDVLLRGLPWAEVLTWFERYRERHRWTVPGPPAAAPRPHHGGHHRSARAERPRRTFTRTLPWGRALAPLPCAP